MKGGECPQGTLEGVIWSESGTEIPPSDSTTPTLVVGLGEGPGPLLFVLTPLQSTVSDSVPPGPTLPSRPPGVCPPWTRSWSSSWSPGSLKIGCVPTQSQVPSLDSWTRPKSKS